jgi:hypothetical protein
MQQQPHAQQQQQQPQQQHQQQHPPTSAPATVVVENPPTLDEQGNEVRPDAMKLCPRTRQRHERGVGAPQRRCVVCVVCWHGSTSSCTMGAASAGCTHMTAAGWRAARVPAGAKHSSGCQGQSAQVVGSAPQLVLWCGPASLRGCCSS